jgi:hypothetical protein
MADMICHKVYEFLMSILRIYTLNVYEYILWLQRFSAGYRGFRLLQGNRKSLVLYYGFCIKLGNFGLFMSINYHFRIITIISYVKNSLNEGL